MARYRINWTGVAAVALIAISWAAPGVAQAEGCTIVDMKNDWKRVFSFEGK
jgi:hypothetical protein